MAAGGTRQGSNFFRGMVDSRACELKTIPPRLLADLLGGMVGLVLGGKDHTPYPFGPRPYHTIPRKKLEPRPNDEKTKMHLRARARFYTGLKQGTRPGRTGM